jgi:hypothetical protein
MRLKNHCFAVSDRQVKISFKGVFSTLPSYYLHVYEQCPAPNACVFMTVVSSAFLHKV